MNLKETIDYQVSLALCEAKSGFDMRKFKSFEYQEDRLKYAREKLEILGEGSSRMVFLLSNRFVLKLAYSYDGDAKGRAQNEQEVDVCTNPRIKPIVTQIYDFDKDYSWLVSEVVREFSSADEFLNFFGATNVMQIYFAMAIIDPSRKQRREEHTSKYIQKFGEPSLKKMLGSAEMKAVQELMEQTGVISGDLQDYSHWGKTADGRVVCLDYGLSEQVYQDHYMY